MHVIFQKKGKKGQKKLKRAKKIKKGKKKGKIFENLGKNVQNWKMF